MAPRVRKVALTAHVVSSVGWLGAVAAFLALAIAGVTSGEPQVVRSAYVAADLITTYVIVPLALVSLLSGLVQALGTTWGLFGHYWVVLKLLLTVFAVVVLLLELEPIDDAADAATGTILVRGDLHGARSSLVVHACGGLVVLLTAATLSVLKPRGLTPYGRRHRNEAEPRQDGLA